MVGKIKNKEEIAQGTLMVAFQLKEPANFKSGQYIAVTLPHLNYPDGQGQKRLFSINNDPSDNTIIQITTRLSESGFKKTLNELPLESVVELGPIAGEFSLPENPTRPLAFIAGGIGITPFMSMLRHIIKEKLPYKITLIYSNRNQASAAYLDELQNYPLPPTAYRLILTMTDDPEWTGEKRIIDAQFIKDYFPRVNEQCYFVVGPPMMVNAVQRSLLEAGVGLENIKIENFTGY